MEGEQEIKYQALIRIANKVRDGAYGKGNDFDVDALEQDIEEQVWEN